MPQHTSTSSTSTTSTRRPRRTATLGLAVGAGLTASLLSSGMSAAQADQPAKPAGYDTYCVSDPMGIPAKGKTYLGAAINGTSSLDHREQQVGHNLSLFRSYFQANAINAAVTRANTDLAAGRLPWISFKEPLSWADMAAGKGNAWATQLADALGKVNGPVWLAVHHEPEKDGDMALWTEMQRQISRIVHERTDNVAYSVIYSSWNTFRTGPENGIASKWPGDEYVDITGIDAYNDYKATRNGKTGKKQLNMLDYYTPLAAWAKEHGTAWAVGETGQTSAAAAEDPKWLERTYYQMKQLGGAGLSYYDSSANSVADWTLDDNTKLAAFKRLQPKSAFLC